MKRTAIESLLPGIFRRTLTPGNPGSGFLDVMEDRAFGEQLRALAHQAARDRAAVL